jgi:hypothetical protein
MNNEFKTQNISNVKMNSIKVKYEDLVLTDSDEDLDSNTIKKTDFYWNNNLINNSVFKIIRNNKRVKEKNYSPSYKKIDRKISKISKLLKQVYYKVNKKIDKPNYLLNDNQYSNIFVKQCINFIETNYIKIVNNKINLIDKKNNIKLDLENIYVIRFFSSINYLKIISIYKKIQFDINDDFKLLFANPIFELVNKDNLDLQTITFFKNKVKSKKNILDEYFKKKIKYYNNINTIINLIYNFLGVIIILGLSIYYENIVNSKIKK